MELLRQAGIMAAAALAMGAVIGICLVWVAETFSWPDDLDDW